MNILESLLTAIFTIKGLQIIIVLAIIYSVIKIAIETTRTRKILEAIENYIYINKSNEKNEEKQKEDS